MKLITQISNKLIANTPVVRSAFVFHKPGINFRFETSAQHYASDKQMFFTANLYGTLGIGFKKKFDLAQQTICKMDKFNHVIDFEHTEINKEEKKIFKDFTMARDDILTLPILFTAIKQLEFLELLKAGHQIFYSDKFESISYDTTEKKNVQVFKLKNNEPEKLGLLSYETNLLESLSFRLKHIPTKVTFKALNA